MSFSLPPITTSSSHVFMVNHSSLTLQRGALPNRPLSSDVAEEEEEEEAEEEEEKLDEQISKFLAMPSPSIENIAARAHMRTGASKISSLHPMSPNNRRYQAKYSFPVPLSSNH